ncbi:MMPL family transporter [Patescibacteria group bacterium]|nr:MMPL family transporter [Patescibacteria group bacterium]
MAHASTRNKWWRVFIPAALLLVWLALAGVGGPYFGKIDQVSSNDLSTFLPKNAESTKVKDELAKFQTSGTIPAIVVFESDASLTDTQKSQLMTARDNMQKTGVVMGEVSQPVYSDDGKGGFVLVPIDSDTKFAPVITKLQDAVKQSDISMRSAFTGPAMFARDLNKAFAGIDGTLLVVALAVVFLILLVVYRSPVLPIVTLMSAIAALASAIFVVWHLANAGVMQLNGQVQGILFILVIGAATDYALLYISRYREELTLHESAWDATQAALKASWEPIVAAGGTVILGLLCLLVSDLGSNKALGPVGGVGIAFAIASALTFLPAALLLFGRRAFWPRRPRYMPGKGHGDYHDNHPVWTKVGRLVGKHPRRLWVGISILLIACCVYIPQLRAQGVSQQDLIVGKSEARDGQILLDRHFPGGSGSPAFILVPESQQVAVVKQLETDYGVDSVSVLTSDKTRTSMLVGRSEIKLRQQIREKIAASRQEQLDTIRTKIEAEMAGAPAEYIEQFYQQAIAAVPSVDSIAASAYPFKDLQPKVVDGQVVLQATLKDPASSVQARETISRLRATIQPTHPEVIFGGVSAVQLDTNTASTHDLKIIIPLILLAITSVLMLLLRSVVAPLILLATTVVSFGATLGVAAFLFNNVWHFPGADPSVIIFGFVFLVALGIDYNIFLMTRVREETIRLGVRQGTLKALVVTGGVITSAGVVLASTFAALYVIPILFLAQIAFIVSFGVLLDTLIIRSLLVPSLTLEIGKKMWWPSRISKKGKR